jgi:hypothetical protein
MTVVITLAICGFIGTFGYNLYRGQRVERSLIDAAKCAALLAFVAFLVNSCHQSPSFFEDDGRWDGFRTSVVDLPDDVAPSMREAQSI